MDTLVIAICTRGRAASLSRLLDCLALQEWPAGASVLVVDNDPSQSARVVVEQGVDAFPVPLDYVAQEKPGYATVRNSALDRVGAGTAVCFIDDDALVPGGWVPAMRTAQASHPTAVIRSRYLHVAQFPESINELSRVIGGGQLSSLQPAGTSGLLLPSAVVEGFRFDPYFDHSGAEDMDLLARLQEHGFVEHIADAVVVEEDRVQVMSLAQQRALARWNGRLATIALARRGSSTLGFRWRALLQALSAWANAALRSVLGRRQASAAYRSLAASRWAMVTAPLHPPSSLPARPVL